MPRVGQHRCHGQRASTLIWVNLLLLQALPLTAPIWGRPAQLPSDSVVAPTIYGLGDTIEDLGLRGRSSSRETGRSLWLVIQSAVRALEVLDWARQSASHQRAEDVAGGTCVFHTRPERADFPQMAKTVARGRRCTGPTRRAAQARYRKHLHAPGLAKRDKTAKCLACVTSFLPSIARQAPARLPRTLGIWGFKGRHWSRGSIWGFCPGTEAAANLTMRMVTPVTSGTAERLLE